MLREFFIEEILSDVVIVDRLKEIYNNNSPKGSNDLMFVQVETILFEDKMYYIIDKKGGVEELLDVIANLSGFMENVNIIEKQPNKLELYRKGVRYFITFSTNEEAVYAKGIIDIEIFKKMRQRSEERGCHK